MCVSVQDEEGPLEDPDEMFQDDGDAYYIMIRKPEELMPPSCVFDKLERADADKYAHTTHHIPVSFLLGL